MHAFAPEEIERSSGWPGFVKTVTLFAPKYTLLDMPPVTECIVEVALPNNSWAAHGNLVKRRLETQLALLESTR